MSKLIASSAIRGAHNIVEKAEQRLKEAFDARGSHCPVEFPNTAYYLPVIYALTGRKVSRLADLEPVLALARELLPPLPAERLWAPYLGATLDAGIATLFAEEALEAIRCVLGSPPADGFWLGAADDVIMRERGIEFVDGRAPGFAAVVGKAPDAEVAVRLAREMQQKSLYVFMAGHVAGETFARQLSEAGVQLGWESRLVPFGQEVYSHIYSLGFAARVALSFGGVTPGDYSGVLLYNKNRVFAFVLALGPVTDEWYATAAGALSFGFPTIAQEEIPQILPSGVCTYEHVVSGIPLDKIVNRAIEVRGLKVPVAEVQVPVAFGPAFEGEIVRRADTQVEIGGGASPAFEWVTMRPMHEVEDGVIEVLGPDLDSVLEGGSLPYGMVVEVAGRKLQEDFEPVLERRIHHFINYLEGVAHTAQRDILRLRISKKAFQAGLRLHHLGEAVHAKMKSEFSSILDKVRVTIYTRPEEVEARREEARQSYARRDQRLAALTDDTVETFYTCTLCQSFAPSHVCIVTPERIGLCGSVSWLDARASYEIKPTGPNQPVPLGTVLDPVKGRYSGVNEALARYSQGKLTALNLYSMLEDPMTSCGCFEAILAVVPEANGIMIVNREYAGETPVGMKFSTLAGMVGGGQQMPGFMGIGKVYIASRRFIQADGGLKRVVWMPRQLKEILKPGLLKRGEELGLPDLWERIADETVGTTPEEILPYLQEKKHPALEMEPLM